MSGRIVVITGASSGLGRATAIELATRGCIVVLAARRGDALEETAQMCRQVGGEAHVVVTDVTSEAEVNRLCATTLERFGRIDVWINNAGVTLYAALEDATFEEHRRVLEVNILGAILCARAVVPVFRRQHRGTMINIGSVLSHVGQAFVPSYSISKFALRGMSEALRVELADERDIHICTVYPFALDTPHFQTAANRVGHKPRAIPPMQSPEKVARAIAGVIERPRRARYVPRWIVLGLVAHALAPRLTEQLLLAALRRWHFKGDQPSTPGNLYVPPTAPATTHGERPPQLGMPKFLGWLAGRLVREELLDLGHAIAKRR